MGGVTLCFAIAYRALQIRCHGVAWVVLMSLCLVTLQAGPAASSEPRVDFNRQIRPILSEHCFTCHGPDEGKRKAGLRLDRQEGAFSKLKSGQYALVAGKPESSTLVERILTKDPDEITTADIEELFPEARVAEILGQRAKTYGTFKDNARVAQGLKRVMAEHAREKDRTFADDQWEALEMIASKISRIINGDPDSVDQWDDIAGYATLIADRLRGVVK